MSRKFLLTASILGLLTIATARLQAGYLQAYSGNTEAASTGGAQIAIDFATLDRLTGGSPGDVFGTGFAGFDSLVPIDTSARYLYLYQTTIHAGFFAGFRVGDGQTRFTGATDGQWNLALADNSGAVSSSNVFGLDGVAFAPGATANLGVTSPSLVSAGSLVGGTLSLTPNDFHINYALNPGQTSVLFGFTSNSPPIIVPAPAAGPLLATGAVPAPAIVPEPGSILLLALGLLGLLFIRRRKA